MISGIWLYYHLMYHVNIMVYKYDYYSVPWYYIETFVNTMAYIVLTKSFFFFINKSLMLTKPALI